MNLALLTTDTLHHCRFLDALAEFCPPILVLAERSGPGPEFDTHHPFEDERLEHERQLWFGGASVCLRDLGPVFEVQSVNDPDAVDRLAAATPEIVIVFGTGRLEQQVIDVCPHATVNLHGGNPEHYRGLDTHLWAIHESDFEGLVTTLHCVNERLDDGDIVAGAPVGLSSGMGLHELRACTTDVCVELARSALRSYIENGYFESRPQRQRGQYYSFMPAAVKDVCAKRFADHTATLPGVAAEQTP